MDKRDTASGWWHRLFPAGRTTDTTATGQAGASAEWRYSWLLPGDAALAAPPAVSPELKELASDRQPPDPRFGTR